MAYARYEPMIGDIRKVQSAVETSLNLRQPAVDKAAVELYATSPQEAIAYLTQYSCDAAEASTARWKKLGEYLMVKFLDGNVKQEENGKFKDNGYGLPDFPLFPKSIKTKEIITQIKNTYPIKILAMGKTIIYHTLARSCGYLI